MYHPVFQRVDSISRIVHLLDKVITPRLPQTAMIHNIMRAYLEKSFSNHIDTKFFAWKGVNDKEQTFIVASQYRSFFGDTVMTFAVPPDPDAVTPPLLRGLEELLDWKSRLSFKTSFNPELLKSWCEKRGTIFEREPSIPYYMEIKTALELYPRKVGGYRLGLLYPREANDLALIWPDMDYIGSAANLIDCIETFGGIGIYRKEKIVGSILNSTSGQMFVFYVGKGHRDKGIGDWALGALAGLLSQRDMYPNALISESDLRSQHVFAKVGFKRGTEKFSEIRFTPYPSEETHPDQTNFSHLC